jgi:hypothetical protein
MFRDLIPFSLTPYITYGKNKLSKKRSQNFVKFSKLIFLCNKLLCIAPEGLTNPANSCVKEVAARIRGSHAFSFTERKISYELL